MGVYVFVIACSIEINISILTRAKCSSRRNRKNYSSFKFIPFACNSLSSTPPKNRQCALRAFIWLGSIQSSLSAVGEKVVTESKNVCTYVFFFNFQV